MKSPSSVYLVRPGEEAHVSLDVLMIREIGFQRFQRLALLSVQRKADLGEVEMLEVERIGCESAIERLVADETHHQPGRQLTRK